LQLAARRTVAETAVAAMMAEHDPPAKRLGKRAPQVVVGIVVDERAGVDAHPTVLFHHHLAERAHECAAAVLRLETPHAAFGYCRHVPLDARRTEVRKRDDTGRG